MSKFIIFIICSGSVRKLIKKPYTKFFPDPIIDVAREHLKLRHPYFALEYLPGQYDQRADAVKNCLRIIVPGAIALVQTGQLLSISR